MIRNVEFSLSYWECLWNMLQRIGWHLSHHSFTDEDTGGCRHLVRAQRKDVEVVCSAPTMSQAVERICTAIENREAA